MDIEAWRMVDDIKSSMKKRRWLCPPLKLPPIKLKKCKETLIFTCAKRSNF
jgi:hypothetical protein